MVEVKTLSPFDHYRAVELRATPRALAALGRSDRALCAVCWPKAVGVGQLAGPWPSRSLWLCAPMQPTETMNFSIFFRIIQIQFRFESFQILFKLGILINLIQALDFK
jgi:hypothetical protein